MVPIYVHCFWLTQQRSQLSWVTLTKIGLYTFSWSLGILGVITPHVAPTRISRELRMGREASEFMAISHQPGANTLVPKYGEQWSTKHVLQLYFHWSALRPKKGSFTWMKALLTRQASLV